MTIFALAKNTNLLSHTSGISPIGQSFIFLSSVDSTNNYAMARIHEGLALHGTVYFAMQQTAGKGQRGKSWASNPGENILMSAVIQPESLTISNQFLLSASMTLACYDFFKRYSDEKYIRIKWPNDLYWQDRKAAGILVENIVKSRDTNSNWEGVDMLNSTERVWRWAVVGIGININQTNFAEDIKNAASLKQISGKEFDVLPLAKELCECLEKRYSLLLSSSPEVIMEEYNSLLYKRHQPVKLKKENMVFETFIQGVSDSGQLLTKDAIQRGFNFGEVEWMI